MGHGDMLVIADSNFPSDSVAAQCVVKQPIRINGKTSEILQDILTLFPLDQYVAKPVSVMDPVPSDKAKNILVPAFDEIAHVAGIVKSDLDYVERFAFYEKAKNSFVVVQSDDSSLYANVIIVKGVIV